MIEAAFVFDKNGEAIHWHLIKGRTEVKIPDSEELWNILWSNKEEVMGVAHSHPWPGNSSPSLTDITTFSAIERGLGKRLIWPIATLTDIDDWTWAPAVKGYVALIYPHKFLYSYSDIVKLREISRKGE